MPAKFQPELLLLARQFRKMSQADVAFGARLNQGHFSRIERGLLNDEPTEASINAIADALDFPASFFYQSDDIAGLPLSVHDANYRKRAKFPAGDLAQLHAELNLRIMHIRRYLQAVDITSELVLPSWDVDEVGGPTKAAIALRQIWMIPPDTPIKNLTTLCERAGILVIWCNFSTKVDGVTMRMRDLPPIVFLNRNAPADRMRQTLAHELGHLILHEIPTDDMEHEADEFAGEFLVPAKSLKSDLIGGKVTLPRLAQMKLYWRVSIASLLYRAAQHGLVSENQSGYLWRKISYLGWRKREPEETEFDREEPMLFEDVLALHENELGYGIDDFSNMLHISANDFRSFYGMRGRDSGPRRDLYIVK